MHEIHVFDKNAWLANYLYCIKMCAIGRYASGYMDCRLVPVLYSIFFWSTAFSIKSTVA